MENSRTELNDGAKPIDQNRTCDPPAAFVGDAETAESSTTTQLPSPTTVPSLSQADVDLILSRALQEHEAEAHGRYGSSGSGSNVDDGEFNGEDYEEMTDYENLYGFAESGHDLDPREFVSDESYARALQEAEERDLLAQYMGSSEINYWRAVGSQDYGGNPPDAWRNIDPDNMSYEELLALGEVIGTASRGLSCDAIASLPSLSFKAKSAQDDPDQCVICQMDFEDGDSFVRLFCKHEYHFVCIKTWLQRKKVCPVCITEVVMNDVCSENQR